MCLAPSPRDFVSGLRTFLHRSSVISPLLTPISVRFDGCHMSPRYMQWQEAGLYFIFLLVHFLSGTGAFREQISLFNSKQLAYPYFVHRHGLVGPASQSGVLAQEIFIAVNVSAWPLECPPRPKRVSEPETWCSSTISRFLRVFISADGAPARFPIEPIPTRSPFGGIDGGRTRLFPRTDRGNQPGLMLIEVIRSSL